MLVEKLLQVGKSCHSRCGCSYISSCRELVTRLWSQTWVLAQASTQYPKLFKGKPALSVLLSLSFSLSLSLSRALSVSLAFSFFSLDSFVGSRKPRCGWSSKFSESPNLARISVAAAWSLEILL